MFISRKQHYEPTCFFVLIIKQRGFSSRLGDEFIHYGGTQQSYALDAPGMTFGAGMTIQYYECKLGKL